MRKYGLPEWVRPYVYRYARENPIKTVRFAISLMDAKRKKGAVIKGKVHLPNGTAFKEKSITKVLNLFFHGEEGLATTTMAWATSSKNHNREYESHFMRISERETARAKAIRNLVEGLGLELCEEPKSISEVFSNISVIEPWEDRIIAVGIILRYSYASTFGALFYRAFYPVAPEFMRSFGTVFADNKGIDEWETHEARRIIESNVVNREHLLELSRNLLARILWSVQENMGIAREMSLEREVKLLGDICVAYPLEVLKGMGVEIDVEKEVKTIRSMLQKIA